MGFSFIQGVTARLVNHRNDTMIHASALSTRPLGWLLAASLALGSTAAMAGQPPAGQVFIADEHGASLTHIQLESGVTTTQDISISPHNVEVSADGRYLLAVGDAANDDHAHGGGGHAHGDDPGELQVFNIGDFGAGPLASIPVGSHPAHVVSDLAGHYAFVTNAGDDTISIVDLEARQAVATVETGHYPHGLRLSPDGGELYVANVLDGSVSVIDVTAREEVARIPVGDAPVQVGFTPNGEQVYVSLRDENRVAVIDTASRSVMDSVAVGRLPIQVHATPDGSLVLVANEGSKADPDNRVSVIDTATREVVATFEVGMGAHGVSVDDSGRFAFITNIHDDSLSVIDLALGEVIANHATGQGPNGVTWVTN